MAKHSAANERMKRQYFEYLREAQRRNTSSVDQAAAALSRFEDSTGFKDFNKFHRAQAVAFKTKLNRVISPRSGKPLSRATVNSTLNALRSFFVWLADKPGYKSRIAYSDADYFNLSEKDVRIAQAKRHKAFPSLDQVHRVLSVMPSGSDIEKRNRALLAFALLTGARDGALSSFKLKHVDLVQERVNQDAREVRTKASKTFSTTFFPVGGIAREIVQDWCCHLRTVLLFGDEDPLFPATRVALGPGGGFIAKGLRRDGWTSAGPVRKVFQQAFEKAGLPYFNPHSFRDTLVQLGQQVCPTVEAFKAWSQNLGHKRVMTTLTSYGTIAPNRQAELIRGMGAPRSASTLDPAALAQVFTALQALTAKVLA